MPSTVYLVTGGTRSGKSSYAQRLCESLCSSSSSSSSNPIYVATSDCTKWNKHHDADFQQRIQRHQADRGEHWTTIEEPLQPSQHLETFKGKVVLVDCLTLWLTNYFMAEGAFLTNTEPSAKDNEGQEDDDDNADDNVQTTKHNMDTTGTQRSCMDTRTPSNELAERALTKIKHEFDTLIAPWDVTFVFVTNELGSGTHASNEMSRKFVDAHGWFNQHVAAASSRVVHMICGIPNVIRQQQQQQQHGSAIIPISQEKADQAKMLDQFLSARKITMDPNGYFLLKLDHSKGVIVASFYSCIVNEQGECCDFEGNKIPCHNNTCSSNNNRSTYNPPLKVWECRTAKELTTEIFERWPYAQQACTMVGHAAYIGREAQKAEDCLYKGQHYQQD